MRRPRNLEFALKSFQPKRTSVAAALIFLNVVLILTGLGLAGVVIYVAWHLVVK